MFNFIYNHLKCFHLIDSDLLRRKTFHNTQIKLNNLMKA